MTTIQEQLLDECNSSDSPKSIRALCGNAAIEIERLESRVKELERDKNRLDWLTENFYASEIQECKEPDYKSWVFHVPSKDGYTVLREAIDLAMNQSK